MNYARTCQHTPNISGLLPLPISNVSINAEMYGYNSLHPAPSANVTHTLQCTGIIHYTLPPLTNVHNTLSTSISDSSNETLPIAAIGRHFLDNRTIRDTEQVREAFA